MMSTSYEDEDYFVPLEDQRVFGAGLKRKRVAFVPSSTTETSFSSSATRSKSADIGSRYLSIVLPQTSSGVSKEKTPTTDGESDNNPRDLRKDEAVLPRAVSEPPQVGKICPVCNLPLALPAPSSIPHETTIAHQASLPHSHPPSHLPREHVGLKYLSSYGWDPDSRLGLGAKGAGIRIPIKAKEKKDTVGLGVEIPTKGKKLLTGSGPIKRLNAKEVRKMEEEGKKRREKLQKMFNQNEDVLRYLGEDG